MIINIIRELIGKEKLTKEEEKTVLYKTAAVLDPEIGLVYLADTIKNIFDRGQG